MSLDNLSALFLDELKDVCNAEQTLAEEEAADRKLTELGENGINAAAMAAGGEGKA